MLADSILVWPEGFGHGFADQHRAGPASNVGIINVTSAQERYMHGAHISGADEAYIHFGQLGHGRRRPARHGNRLVRAVTAQWQTVNESGRLHAGQAANALENSAEVSDLLR